MELSPLQAGVSRREGEVLALVGEHLTNAEIAERLFISVRTVESHVATLLRKLELPDKRALAAHAIAISSAGAAPASHEPAGGTAIAVTGVKLPVALTAFVGRDEEREGLGRLVDSERLVTLLGPGGVGKTRLATVTAGDLAADFDSVAFIDLVPVIDPDMITAAAAATLGIAEVPGRALTDTVTTWIGSRRILLVLDNCEHVLDGAAAFAERALAACEKLTLLTTSRARLMLPFERVFSVGGLSLPDDDDFGDAVRLFEDRAAAVGAFVPPTDLDRVAAVCLQLDGVALAIELAASRLSGLGIDGLEAGLTEPLRMLAGGTRVHERHHSLRATLDWSWSLLDQERQALLEQVCVFAAPFSATDAAAVIEPPMSPAAVAEGLAHLVDNSLLIARPSASETRYRALEVVRQYGQGVLAERGDLTDLQIRHLRWCLGTASALNERRENRDPAWRHAFDQVSDDFRAALLAASAGEVTDDEASHLALHLARLEFARGNPAEAQRRFVQGARLAQRLPDRLAALVDAANADLARQSGSDYLATLDDAIALADDLGDARTATTLRARAAEVIQRFQGIFDDVPDRELAVGYLDRAEAAGLDDPDVRASVALAAAGVFGGPERAEVALELARLTDDPVLVSAGLDAVTAERLAQGDPSGAVEMVRMRLAVLERIPADVSGAMELNDGYLMSADVMIGVGDLAAATESADRLAALPFYEGVPYVAISRQLRVDLMIGEILRVVEGGRVFESTWERAGRPAIGQLAPTAWAIATAHGLRGELEREAAWKGISLELRRLPDVPLTYPRALDPMVLLHHGDATGALDRLPEDPAEGPLGSDGTGVGAWTWGLWRPWWAAFWAEASVLAELPDSFERIERSRPFVAANPIARALVDRAAAIASGDMEAVLAAGTALQAAGSRYQYARTLILVGKRHRSAGLKLLVELGVTASD